MLTKTLNLTRIWSRIITDLQIQSRIQSQLMTPTPLPIVKKTI